MALLLFGSNRSSYSVKGVGDKDEVLKVQKYLRTFHYLPERKERGKDGVFDDATHRALIKFRKQFNLALLMDQDGKQYNQATFSDYQKEQSLSLHLLEIYAKIIENKDGSKTKKVDWIYYDLKKQQQSVTIGKIKYTTIKIMERLEHAGYTIPMTEKKMKFLGTQCSGQPYISS